MCIVVYQFNFLSIQKNEMKNRWIKFDRNFKSQKKNKVYLMIFYLVTEVVIFEVLVL